MTATADQQASQNRLKIRVNVRFTNRNKEIDNFERTFEFFYDYPAQQLSGATLNSAIKVILKELHKIYLMNLLRNGNHTCLMRLKKLKSENERNCLYFLNQRA
jgi:hypothetical protein